MGSRELLAQLTTALEQETATNVALVTALRAEIAALKLEVTPTPVPVPVPTAPTTRFGACPPSSTSGTSLAAVQGVVDRFGPKACGRHFAGAFSTPARRVPDNSIVHWSWKPTLGDITDNNVRTAVAGLRAGDVVEVWHEADKKVTDGLWGYTELVALKNKFYDTVHRVRPDLLVANTLTGWLIEPKSGKDLARWGAVKADVLGADCDGIHVTALPYPNYDAEIISSQTFIKTFASNGYKFWAVPEFGTSRFAADSGSGRAAWVTEYGKKFKAGGALYVAVFNYGQDELNATVEINALKALVAAS